MTCPFGIGEHPHDQFVPGFLTRSEDTGPPPSAERRAASTSGNHHGPEAPRCQPLEVWPGHVSSTHVRLGRLQPGQHQLEAVVEAPVGVAVGDDLHRCRRQLGWGVGRKGLTEE